MVEFAPECTCEIGSTCQGKSCCYFGGPVPANAHSPLMAPDLVSQRAARPGTIAVPEELAWRASTWLRVLSGVILSGEVKEAVRADQSAWFALLTEAPNA